MSTRCEDVTDRLMELLYQELPAGERAALEAHVAGCERCRAELASFQKTRRLARAALDGPAPAGVRQRLVAAAVLEAARGATTARATAARAPVIAAPAAPAASGGGDGGLWQKLRGRWTFPTLATLGAMAVFLLGSRVFLDQDSMVERGRRFSQDRGAPAAVAEKPAAPAPAALDRLAAARSEEKPAAASPAEPSPPARRPAGHGRSRAGGSAAAAPPAAGESRSKVSVSDDPLLDSRLRQDSSLATPATNKVARQPSVAGKAARKPSPFPAVAEEGDQPAGDRGDDLPARRSAAASRHEVAPAPVAAVAAPPPAPARPASARPASGGSSLEDLVERPAARTRLSPSSAPAASSSAGAATASAESAPAPLQERSRIEPKSKRSDEKSAVENEREAQGSPAAAEPASAEALAQRAERLFAEARWSEAITAFERLLRQYPRNALAPQWRKRLAAARVELKTTEMPP